MTALFICETLSCWEKKNARHVFTHPHHYQHCSRLASLQKDPFIFIIDRYILRINNMPPPKWELNRLAFAPSQRKHWWITNRFTMWNVNESRCRHRYLVSHWFIKSKVSLCRFTRPPVITNSRYPVGRGPSLDWMCNNLWRGCYFRFM